MNEISIWSITIIKSILHCAQPQLILELKICSKSNTHIHTNTNEMKKKKMEIDEAMQLHSISLSVSDLVMDYSLFMIASVHLNGLDNFSFDLSEPLSK